MDAVEKDWESRLEEVVASHPEALAFSSSDDVSPASRFVLKLQPQDEANSFTHGTLISPGCLSARPFVFTNNTTGSLLAFYHLGHRLSGHTGIVHGGVTAALLDECMGRACFPRLEGKIAVTARLEIEYKNPIPVDSLVLISAETTDVQGRKATVEATVRDAMDGTELVRAKALFVEPKWASSLTKLM